MNKKSIKAANLLRAANLFRALTLLITVVFAGALVTCDNILNNGETVLTINLSGGSNNGGRSAMHWPPTDYPGMLEQIEFEITLTGSEESKIFTATGNASIRAAVSAGRWNVYIEAKYGGELYAKGENSVDVKAGQANSVLVDMYKAFPDTYTCECDGDCDDPDCECGCGEITPPCECDNDCDDPDCECGCVETLPTTYLVTVNVNNTAWGSAEAEAAFAIAGEEIRIIATPEDGYTFVKWTAIPAVVFDDDESEETTFTMPESDVTITAEFAPVTPQTYTVIIESSITNGIVTIDGPNDGNEFAAGDQITITAIPNNGYLFDRWTTTPNDFIFDYRDDPIATFTMPAYNLTIYAHFSMITRTVTFITNDRSNVGPITIQHGELINQFYSTISRGDEDENDYYDFDGWYKETELTDAWDFEKDTVTDDITLYAKWTPIKEEGDEGPGGGKIFYVNPNGFTVEGYGSPGDPGYFASYTAYYLEAAPENAETSDGGGFGWKDSSGFNPNILIPGLSQNENDETDWAIGRGRLNTAIIIAHGEENEYTTPDALVCAEYTNNGKNDWFLPSRLEFDELYNQKEFVYEIDDGYTFLSSSQYDSYYGWAMSGGNWRSYGREYGGAVRPIRAF